MKRSRGVRHQEQSFWRPYAEDQQRSVTGKIYACGTIIASLVNGALTALPSQLCDEVLISYPAQLGSIPLDQSLVTVTTNATANTFVQLASAPADQLVIFNQSAASVLSVGFSASPGTAVVPIPANGNFTFLLQAYRNANALFVASAGTSQVFSYMIRQMPQLNIAYSSAFPAFQIGYGQSVVLPVPTGPTFTGNANQIFTGCQGLQVSIGATYPVLWRRYSI